MTNYEPNFDNKKEIFREALKRNILTEKDCLALPQETIDLYKKLTSHNIAGLSEYLNKMDVYDSIDVIIILITKIFAGHLMGYESLDTVEKTFIELKTELRDNKVLLNHLKIYDYCSSQIELEAVKLFNELGKQDELFEQLSNLHKDQRCI